MLIRSQDKKVIINMNTVNHIRVCKSDKNTFYLYAESGIVCSNMPIAEYSTEEKAIKALDMIQAEYLCYMSNNGGGMMATANFYVQPFAFNQPKVFQMPQDSEV